MSKTKNKTKFIYLASPYSHPSRKVEKEREKEINRIGAELQARTGHALFPPITVSAHFKKLLPHKFGTSFSAWKDIDLTVVSKSDEVWVVKMSGWKDSIGVQAEIEYANDNEIPVMYINPKSLRFVK